MDDDMSTWSDESLFKEAMSAPDFRHGLRALKRARRAGRRAKKEIKELCDVKALWDALVALFRDLKSQGSKLTVELKAIKRMPWGSEEQATAVKDLMNRIAVKIGKVLRWVVENLNFWFDHNLKDGNIQKMSDEALLRRNNSTIRAVSGSVTGVLICAGITAGCHIFAVPLVINFWQLVVSVVNHFRVAREMKRRRKEQAASFGRAEEELLRLLVNRPGFQIALGCVTKIGLLAGAIGIVGFANIADGFMTQFGGDGASTNDAANVGAVTKSTVPVHGVAPAHAITVPHHAAADGTGPPPENAGSATNHPMIDALKEHHTLYKLAEGAGNATSPGQELDKPITDAVTGGTKGDAIHMSTPGTEMSRMIHEEGIPTHKVILTALLVAIMNEVFQPLTQLFEIAFNKLIDKRGIRIKVS